MKQTIRYRRTYPGLTQFEMHEWEAIVEVEPDDAASPEDLVNYAANLRLGLVKDADWWVSTLPRPQLGPGRAPVAPAPTRPPAAPAARSAPAPSQRPQKASEWDASELIPKWRELVGKVNELAVPWRERDQNPHAKQEDDLYRACSWKMDEDETDWIAPSFFNKHRSFAELMAGVDKNGNNHFHRNWAIETYAKLEGVAQELQMGRSVSLQVPLFHRGKPKELRPLTLRPLAAQEEPMPEGEGGDEFDPESVPF